MKKIKPDLMFPKVERMLYDLAWKAAKRNPYPNLEEAFAEARSMAYVAFMKACRDYDQTRSSFNTYCWFHIWCKLKSEEMRKSRNAVRFPTLPLTYQDDEGEEQLHQIGTAVRPYFNLEEFTHELSDDAREIINLLIETPHELIFERTPSGLFRRAKRYFIRKWKDEERIREAVREIRSHVAWSLQRT